jgi:hypothetical protein
MRSSWIIGKAKQKPFWAKSLARKQDGQHEFTRNVDCKLRRQALAYLSLSSRREEPSVGVTLIAVTMKTRAGPTAHPNA